MIFSKVYKVPEGRDETAAKREETMLERDEHECIDKMKHSRHEPRQNIVFTRILSEKLDNQPYRETFNRFSPRENDGNPMHFSF